jgi:hypothetical protein
MSQCAISTTTTTTKTKAFRKWINHFILEKQHSTGILLVVATFYSPLLKGIF